ncbi:acyl carrier protein [Amycolatopsis rhizosphaerae]|uniref:Acyl carrier protein n=1 Tax=Amycolatopsis rhizosphaerae TaxID=2053003 RepID=A0A558DJH2_9PSEU|nr:acyl carrier protein [Amycolatopsis rhizosphaerae]TVT61158.1 acyl carrier protein [Amycolatopsis rhizosphaerae]
MSRSTLTRGVLEEFVIDALVAQGATREQITPDVSFDEIGLDSLSVTDMGLSVKNEFGIALAPGDLEDVENLRAALAVIFAKAGL